MNTLVVILIGLLIISLVVLSTLFYFLEKRQQGMLTLNSEKFAEYDAKLALVNENCQTLRTNDEILSKDIETLLHELKSIEKKARRHE